MSEADDLFAEARRVIREQPRLAAAISWVLMHEVVGRATSGGLTRAQLRVYEFIRERIVAGGTAPSYDEIRAHIGVSSKSGVHRIVHALRERGFIDFPQNRCRSIRLVAP